MYIKGLKYACTSCIKGHRSSSCSHIDRPLFEIRKKGRPSSQCALCKDLRKTKQIHAKCECSNNQQPILIYQNNIIPTTKSTTCSVHNNDGISQGNGCTCSILADTPIVSSPIKEKSTIPSEATQPLINAEESPYSWTSITSPSPNYSELPLSSSTSFTALINEQVDDHQLGFIFQKPSSTSKILDGHPRISRRRSTKKNSTSLTRPLSVNLPTRLSTSPCPSVSSLDPQPMDIPFDYLTQQLEFLSNQEPQLSWANEELAKAEDFTTILNTMFQKEEEEEEGLPPSLSPLMPTTPHVQACGSFNSNCCHPVTEGESVVITITPLAYTKDQPTTTRIVTCYCGSLCNCPGCLVHPSSFLSNDPLLNSSASSSYASDEEDIYSNNMNLSF
ncbi:hypothetical protein G6F56_006668 [Rhizopus delemar]|nr:hypothetical protein G6F56_006668 [Rhizopus delemar]